MSSGLKERIFLTRKKREYQIDGTAIYLPPSNFESTRNVSRELRVISINDHARSVSKGFKEIGEPRLATLETAGL